MIKDKYSNTVKERAMKNTTTVTRERSATVDTVSVELGRVGVNAIGITSALIGCWAVVSLVSAMISSGGSGNLILNFVSSFAG